MTTNPWKENGNNNSKKHLSTSIGTATGQIFELENENGKKTKKGGKGGAEGGGEEAAPKEAQSWAEMAREWPKSTLFIVCNEFCERFSYYGMRTVLTLYFLNVLKFSVNSATMVFNGSTVLFYFMPIFGSILADGYLGKFKTIFFLSILYTLGQCVLCFASTRHIGSPLHPWLDILGLVIIGIGTGGIKPCVCSFGGDQFKPNQQKMLSLFFSAFYFAINAGSMISTFVSPMFRATPCLGQDSCYPLAFGVPAALMVLATILFMSASFWYVKQPPKENIFSEVYHVGKNAIMNKWRKGGKKKQRQHWLDFYFDTHLCDNDPKCAAMRNETGDPNECHKRRFVTDVQCLLRLLVIYLPAPMFWALYDQQGSRWLIQAVLMDSRLWGDTLLLPDQMQTLNSVLILLFIPLFQVVFYPFVSLFVKITPLRKMVVGGLLAALAFVLSATVQFQINTTLPDTPTEGHAFVSVMNAFDNCVLKVCAMDGNGDENCRIVGPNQTLTNSDRERPEMFEFGGGKRKWQIDRRGDKCGNIPLSTEVEQMLRVGNTYWMMISRMGVLFGEADTEKPKGGMGEFKVGITLALEDIEYNGNLALCRVRNEFAICDPRRAEDFVGWQVEDGDLMSKKAFIKQNDAQIHTHNATIYTYKYERPKIIGRETMDKGQLNLTETDIELDVGTQGGVYMVALTGNLSNAGRSRTEKRVFHVVPDNSVSILWQIPQFMVITAAEVLFSITGYEFAYSQAAPSMKSLAQALWLMTTAIGDTIILFITLIAFPNIAIEFLFYSFGMVVVTGILALLAIFYYEYNDYSSNAKKKSLNGSEGEEGKGRQQMVKCYGTTE